MYEGCLFLLSHLLLIEQGELCGIKGKTLLGHLPELLLAKISEGVQKFGNLISLRSDCHLVLRHLSAKRFVLLHKSLDLFLGCHCFFAFFLCVIDSEKQ